MDISGTHWIPAYAGMTNGVAAANFFTASERIPEDSHWVIHEQPQQVSSAIREFLAEG